MIRLLAFTIALTGAAMVATHATAADARRGERLAQDKCAACHSVAPHAREEVAEAPPFETIARQYGFDADAIRVAITGPRRKMNFMPDPGEAADIAAYMASLGP
ncbi:MAG TPA: c-type cytochrome [Pseudolabrys sp.]|jgi:mono/diheme cytochrome c family protein|nr:c-type cytochrome [Pseudolabrys sp.]